MTKNELKQLIVECLEEESQNVGEGFFDTLKHVGKGIAGDIKNRYDTAVVAGSKDEFKRLRATVLGDLTAAYKKAQSVGSKAKMSPNAIKKVYVSALTDIITKIKTGTI
jgi:hypothetical protein